MPGDIKQILCMEIQSKNLTKDVFVLFTQYERYGIINFYKWNKRIKQMVIDNDLLALHPKDMNIVDITKLRFSGHDFLIVETQHQYSGLFKHTFFTFIDEKYCNVFEMHSNATKQLIPISVGEQNCFASYSEQRRNLAISCSYIDKRGMLSFRVVQKLMTTPLRQVKFITSAKRHELILLDTNGLIKIWTFDNGFRFTLMQNIKLTQRVRHLSVGHFSGIHFIAICTQHIKNAAEYGTVEIYKSSKEKYVHMQSVATDIAIRAELSVLPTKDFVLYVLTNSLTKALIVYQYSGVMNFRKMIAATTIPQGQELAVMKATIVGKEFVSIIVPGHGLMIIEAIFK